MKAVRFSEYGDSGVLRYEDVDTPAAGPGQVLVRVAASSFNPIDVSIRAGFLQQAFPVRLPHIPGIDVAGTVAAHGEDVVGFAVGDAVVGFLPMDQDGAAAEFVLAPADVLTAAPTSVELADAAAMPSAALTAWQALFEHADLRAGQRILVNGAGGGVGGFAVQLAREAGAYVIATASARSAEAVRAQGADEVVDYTATTLADALDEPVDVVLSLVAGPPEDMAALVTLIRPGGVIVTTATPAPADPARDVRAISVYVRSDAAQLAALVDKVDAGALRVDVSGTFPLADLAEVHDRGAAGEFRGKVVVTPSG